MPGAIAGAIQGFEAADASHARAAMLNAEQQRIGLEKQRQDYEQGRQEAFDTLAIAQERQNALANVTAPHFAALGGMDAQGAGPPQDPEKLAAWSESDAGRLYQEHLKAISDHADDIAKAAADTSAAQQAIVGHIFGAARQQAAKTSADLAMNKPVGDIPSGDLMDMFSLKAQLEPQMLVPGQNGQVPLNAVNQTIHDNVVDMSRWNSPDPEQRKANAQALQVLVPQMKAMVGKPVNPNDPSRGTITDVIPTSATVSVDENGRKIVSFQKTLVVHTPDGKAYPLPTPTDKPFQVPLDALIQRAAGLQKLGDAIAHPEIAAKMADAFRARTTSWHKVQDTLLQAGVDPARLMGGTYAIKSVPGGYVTSRPGLAPEFTSTVTKVTTATQRQPFIDILSDPDSTPEEKQDAQNSLAQISASEKGYSGLKDPNIRATRSSVTDYNASVDERVKSGDITFDQGKKLKNDFLANKAGQKPTTETNIDTTVNPDGSKKTVITKGTKAPAEIVAGPTKPKGTVWTSKDGKTKRISLGGGKWQTQ